jgi:predicted NBD/HSP70 family sugar kinase
MAIKHSGRIPAHHVTTGADDRGARLAVSLSGTNLARAGDYNQRIVLQAIRIAGETTRTALADTTGLTAPTIANITRRLLDRGLIVEAGRHQGARGQPAIRLTINPAGCFAIGINIDRDHLTIVSIDLGGRVLTRMSREIAFAMPEPVAALIAAEVAVIRASGLVDERLLLGVGVAVPDDLGRVPLPHRPAGYEVWNDLDVAALVGEVVPWPVHIDNDAAAAAIGEAQFGSGLSLPSFFYVLISAGLGGGLVIDGSYVRGARGRGGEIGFLPDASVEPGQTVQETVSLSALYARLEAAGCPVDGVDDLVSDEPMVAEVVAAWLDDAARSLTAPLIAVNCIVDPGAVLIGGRLPTSLVEALVQRLDAILQAADLPSVARVGRATMSDDAPAIGAAILPFLDNILPSDIILMQARRQ